METGWSGCYEAAMMTALVAGRDRSEGAEGLPRAVHPEVCHGLALEPSANVLFGHAWVEARGVAFDNSKGRGLVMPVADYYRQVWIRPQDVRRYSLKRALALIRETGTWGPWEGPVRGRWQVVRGVGPDGHIWEGEIVDLEPNT
jgi:hypothetical protein